jgi:LPS sulfotransferase NodH
MHPLRYALIVSALLAAGAFLPHHGYNYFVLLKWAIFATAVWAGVVEGQKRRTFAVMVFCIIALIHNPLMRFHFERNVWLVIDGITAVWFVYRAIRMPQYKQIIAK